MNYEPSWNSLKQHRTPKWYQDAKFGIYTHWGVYAVPGCRPNATWYPFHMYREGTPQHRHHVKTYGGPEKFGYKDFIPMLTGEKFDPDEWAQAFKDSGAQYAGPVGEHHDGFAMWDTQYSDWNAKKMGPKRDVVGELAQAMRKVDMRFMVALHHAENWWFYPHWNPAYDTADPRYAGLYGEPHDLDFTGNTPPNSTWGRATKPSKAFLDLWLSKTREVIDRYQPDVLWFDFALEFIQEHYKREAVAHYFNRALEWDREVVIEYKNHDLAVGSGVVDLELGRFDRLMHNEWVTDTTVDDGEGWGYLRDARYKTPASLIHYLIDNVSKNGHLLLNVGPMPAGELPEEARRILKEMGAWLRINGEAIYGATPWMKYGEGPTVMEKAGAFNEDQPLPYKPEDVRFTTKDDALYAISLGWPTNELNIESLRCLYPREIKRVTMLGAQGELPWRMTESGLCVGMPETRPCDHACTIKIERKHPFDG